MKKTVLFFGLILTLNLMGTVINVPADQPTIQAGIDVAIHADTVLVQPGTYQENLNFNGKNITVGSLFLTTGNQNYIDQTIIDGNQNGSVVTFANNEENSTLLTGFTITNGLYNSSVKGGGGISISENSNPTLAYMNITSNYAPQGAGLYIENSTPICQNLRINNNEASSSISNGGGVYLLNCDNLTFTNTYLMTNYVGHNGSGIAVFGCTNFLMENLIISANENGSWGEGSMFFQNSDGVVINSVVFNNFSGYDSGICGDGGIIFVNSVIYDNNGIQLDQDFIASYCVIEGGFPGNGNLDEDPQFLNPYSGIFSLQDSSPCIGSGINEIIINGSWFIAPEFDIEGNPRPNPTGSVSDIGAVENPLGNPVSAQNSIMSIEDCTLSNFPNPFNPSTTINFNVTQSSAFATIEIYNLKGQKVKTFSNLQITQSQNHQIVWNGTDNNNKPVSSGIYFYKLKSGNIEKTKKMLLLK